MKPFFQLMCAGVVLAASSLSAADSQSQIGVPVLGYVFDPAAQGIRPVSGTPGASMTGDPLDLGMTVTWSAISPRQDFAILARSGAGLGILALPPGNFNSQTLAAGVPQKIVFSPSGETAGLYQQDQAKVQIFTQLPEEPALAHEIDLAGLAGSLLSAAVSDDGNLVLILAGGADNATLWLSYAGGAPVQLQAPAGTSAMAFQGNSDNAAIATEDGQVYLMRNLATGPNLRMLNERDGRTSQPVAVRFSADGERVYVAARQGTVAGFGIRSGGPTFISCGCKPSGLFPLHVSTLIRLNEISDGPLMLVDTVNAEPRIWFVPAVVESVGSARSGQ